MANNSGWYIGYIVYSDFKTAASTGLQNDVLEIKVRIPTSERKKEGEAYAPSFLLSFSVWDKMASSLNTEIENNTTADGKRPAVMVSGELGVPQTYTDKQGEPQCTIKLARTSEVKLLNLIHKQRSDGESSIQTGAAKAPASKTKVKTSAKPAAKPPVSDDFGDFDDLFNEDFE